MHLAINASFFLRFSLSFKFLPSLLPSSLQNGLIVSQISSSTLLTIFRATSSL